MAQSVGLEEVFCMANGIAELELELKHLPTYDGTTKHLTTFISQVDRYVNAETPLLPHMKKVSCYRVLYPKLSVQLEKP